MGAFLEQTNFTAGELSPKLYGQTKLDKYRNAVKRMENFIPLPHGPAVFRPGLYYVGGTKHNDKASRSIPFVFGKNDALVLEFGDYYIRFWKDNVRISTTYSAWLTTTFYDVGALVSNAGSYYRCLVRHTAGTFATDLAAGKWVATSGATDLAYEIVSPYPEADIDGIKYCQSADVAYLFHPDYAVRKLMRYDDDEWEISEADFRPPPLTDCEYSPNATLTPSAATGAFVNFTASTGVFLAGDANREIISLPGKAVIKTVYSSTVAQCEIIHDFKSTAVIASGDWTIKGTPTATLLPSAEGPVNQACVIQTDEGDESAGTLVSIVISGEDCWQKSSKNYYYLKNTASCYTGTKPAVLKHYAAGWIPENADPAALYGWEWGWGDCDSLGYNTIYLCWWWWDPDSIRPNEVLRSSTSAEIDCFRSSDVGRYIGIYNGLVRIDEFLHAQAIKGTILKELTADRDESTNAIEATAQWTMYDELWGTTHGYPSCGTIHEERLCTAGVRGAPDNIRCSQSGDYENFSPGTLDSDALDYSLGGRHVKNIKWLDSREYLIAGTDIAEWRVGSGDSDAPMTPTNVSAKEQTAHGCADIDPIRVGNCTLFVQGALRKIREFTLNPQSVNIEYLAPDLTLLSEHITLSGIKEFCYQKEPFSIVWACLTDGSLIAMTYLREQDVIAWHKHPTTGDVESLCCVPHADGYDQLTAIVKRKINGSDVRYIEALAGYYMDSSELCEENKGENAYYADCGVTYNSTASTTITGGDHLENEPVVVVADGAYVGVKTVKSGAITLDKAASVVHFGLPYEGLLETLPLSMDLKDGTFQGRMKKIIGIIFRLYASGPFKVGRDENHLEDVIYRASDDPMGVAPKVFTGDKKAPYEGGIDRYGRIVIVQDKPLPLQIQAIYPEVSAV